MPIKIDNIAPVNNLQKSATMLYKQPKSEMKFLEDDGNHIMKNYHSNTWNNFIFSILDKITPVLNKYPTFGKKVITISEKILNKNRLV